MSLMTLSEFVGRLAPLSPEEPATLTRQVRLWTEIGLLPLANERFVGQGKARLYTPDSLLVAAVAVELSSWGVPIRNVGVIATQLVARFLAEDNPVVAGAKDGTKEARLLVWMGPHKMLVAGVQEADDELWDLIKKPDAGGPGVSLLMVNLTSLWAELR
jgi:DNA-binding transcriptional MerR regulator